MTEPHPSHSSSGAPLGLYGGTFDPVHLGHLRLAEEAVDALGLAGVRWIPAGQPLLREVPSVAARQRPAGTWAKPGLSAAIRSATAS